MALLWSSLLQTAQEEPTCGTKRFWSRLDKPLNFGESFDSNLNSMNVLNNVDSCDLDEDDLMLDVDLPEDVSLHSACYRTLPHVTVRYRMSPYVTACHRTLPHVTVRYRMSPYVTVMFTMSPYVQHVTMSPHMEENKSVDEVEQLVSSSSSEDSRYQVHELLHQLQKLRAELREKDTLIYNLTQQLPQILQPSERNRLGRVSCRMSSAARSDFLDAQPADSSVNFLESATRPFSVPATVPAVSAAAASLSSGMPNSDNLILLLNSHCRVDESRNCIQLKTNQQPDLLKSGECPQLGSRRGVSHPGISSPSRTRHLPPPSRGLPCISAASQSSLMSTTRGTNIKTISSTKHEQSGLTRTQDLINTSNSRLPKPKSN
ncbi:hypothetical protein Baya_15923 [Bagarius yarrelli]|uniref:Uncharacterized protein n=1 Tax=Bagarius yarrelli TaxID=175774 RepID=A0A556VSR1_BAGYA|nr:hypothetical protein Baya_15923 [Bagarius yarrelli]